MDNIKLNVGGTLYETTKSTLNLSSFFEKALSDTWKKGEVLFIDRSPKIFEHVLCLMRDANYEYPKKYLSELDFYGVKINPINLKYCSNDVVKRLDIIEDKLRVIDADTLHISTEVRITREFATHQCIPARCVFYKCKSPAKMYYCDHHKNVLDDIRSQAKYYTRERETLIRIHERQGERKIQTERQGECKIQTERQGECKIQTERPNE